MEFATYSHAVFWGFLVWLLMAPRSGNARYGERFLAYMTALALCLIGTSEIIHIKPVPFFFTVGGALAFAYIIALNIARLPAKR